MTDATAPANDEAAAAEPVAPASPADQAQTSGDGTPSTAIDIVRIEELCIFSLNSGSTDLISASRAEYT